MGVRPDDRSSPLARILATRPAKPILLPGTRVEGGWTIRAIHARGGERSYFMTNKHDVVFLCPEDCLPRVLEKK